MHLALRLPNRIRKCLAALLAVKGRCLLFSLCVQTVNMKNKIIILNHQNIAQFLELYIGPFLPS